MSVRSANHLKNNLTLPINRNPYSRLISPLAPVMSLSRPILQFLPLITLAVRLWMFIPRTTPSPHPLTILYRLLRILIQRWAILCITVLLKCDRKPIQVCIFIISALWFVGVFINWIIFAASTSANTTQAYSNPYDAALFNAAATMYMNQNPRAAAKTGNSYKPRPGLGSNPKFRNFRAPKPQQLHYCDACKISCAGPSVSWRIWIEIDYFFFYPPVSP